MEGREDLQPTLMRLSCESRLSLFECYLTHGSGSKYSSSGYETCNNENEICDNCLNKNAGCLIALFPPNWLTIKRCVRWDVCLGHPPSPSTCHSCSISVSKHVPSCHNGGLGFWFSPWNAFSKTRSVSPGVNTHSQFALYTGFPWNTNLCTLKFMSKIWILAPRTWILAQNIWVLALLRHYLLQWFDELPWDGLKIDPLLTLLASYTSMRTWEFEYQFCIFPTKTLSCIDQNFW